jgi:hypothetical protein
LRKVIVRLHVRQQVHYAFFLVSLNPAPSKIPKHLFLCFNIPFLVYMEYLNDLIGDLIFNLPHVFVCSTNNNIEGEATKVEEHAIERCCALEK